MRFVSLTGTEPWVQEELRGHVPQEQDRIIRDAAITTIVKERYVEPLTEGKEMSKLFAVNYLDAPPPPRSVLDKIRQALEKEIDGVDAVLLLDFGHGLLPPDLRQFLQENAPYLALNCQTNSNNHGFNIISRKYQRADAFTLDERMGVNDPQPTGEPRFYRRIILPAKASNAGSSCGTGMVATARSSIRYVPGVLPGSAAQGKRVRAPSGGPERPTWCSCNRP